MRTNKVVVSGSVEHVGDADPRDREIAVMRFNADGSQDASLGSDGIAIFDLSTGVVNGSAFSADSAWGLVKYADDRLVVSGGQVHTGGVDTDLVLLRLSADGVRDPGFASNGVFHSTRRWPAPATTPARATRRGSRGPRASSGPATSRCPAPTPHRWSTR